MKTDAEVRKYMNERRKGTSREVAAARAGMSVKTARRYERAGKLPSELKQPHTWETRPNPFAEDWPWVEEQLRHDPALQGTTLFALVCARHPERYRPTQVRTLQRHIAAWRALHGHDKEVLFEQVHQPGEAAQSDFTHMEDLGITIAGETFPHLLFHCVLTYSNVEAIRLCSGETFEALAEGIEAALWQFGGVPQTHRTDHLGAATHPLSADEQKAFKDRYAALMRHYGMQPTLNNTGIAHENGDVEQSHYRFKQAVDQAMRVRGSRDFLTRADYEQFLETLVRQRNATRRARFEVERSALHPLPAAQLSPCRELRVRVRRFSTIAVLGKVYSVPSRLVGMEVLVRVRAEQVQVYRGTRLLLAMPRLVGDQKHAINYRHLIWSLARKPGAFAQYRYRDDLFPSLAFRTAYDHLRQVVPSRADREYVRILHLAATSSESEVETALRLLAEAGQPPVFDQVRDLVRAVAAPAMAPITVDLTPYDALLASQREVVHG
jgi:hypothetical protein